MPDINNKDEEKIEVDTGELGNEEEVDLDRDEPQKANEGEDQSFQPGPDGRPDGDSGGSADIGA